MPHVGDLIAEFLVRLEVTHVFGLPGGQTTALYDGIKRRNPAIQHVLVRDERSAGYAADAYARLTGRPGVCDVTVGPGTTKLPDGLIEALNASIPLIALVGELPRDWETYRDRGVASQGFDQIAFLKTMTKAVWTVPSVSTVTSVLRSAFRTATTGRPGPVAVVIPHDLMDAEWDGELGDETDDRHVRAPAHRPRASDSELDAAVAALEAAERPVVVAGGGVHTSGAYDQLAALAEALDAAVVTSFSGKGAFDERGPLAGGVCNPLGGTSGPKLAREADTLVWLGSKVGQNTSLNWSLPLEHQVTVQIDLDAAELGRTFRPTVAVNGDLRETLDALLARLTPRPRPAWRAAVAEVRDERSRDDAAEASSVADPIAPAAVMRALDAKLSERDIVVSDASFSAGWIATYLTAKGARRGFLHARGLGGLGYAVPAALGAGSVVEAGGHVVTVNGDGGFSYALGELATQAQHGLPVVNVVLNNAALGWIRMWQEMFFGELRQSVDLASGERAPDFAAVAEALGCTGIRVDKAAGLAAAFDAAFDAPGPSVIEIRVDPDATPISSYRRRLAETQEQGKDHARPGTVYELLPWKRSPEPGEGGPEPAGG
jgi:acetolactate synthase-1/2/3 large subunit